MGNVLTPLAVWIGRLDVTRRNAHLVVRLDRGLTRLTRDRLPLLRLAGLPTVVLHVRGRRTGVERSVPLLCTPWRGGYVVVGSNWGEDAPPVWVANLRAARAGEVAVEVRGRRIPVDRAELTGDERAAAWAAAQRVWPNYDRYARRTGREIPVFHLTPADRTPSDHPVPDPIPE